MKSYAVSRNLKHNKNNITNVKANQTGTYDCAVEEVEKLGSNFR
jgi:hypothetical protein